MSIQDVKSQWKAYVDMMKGKGSIEDVLVIDSVDGCQYASTSSTFFLKKYKALISQEDGSEKEEEVNEADSILAFIKGSKPSHGLRINGIKQQVLRNFKDDDTQLTTLYGKVTMGGSCINHAGKCIIIATFDELKGHTSNGCNEVCRLMSIYLYKSSWPSASQSINTIPAAITASSSSLSAAPTPKPPTLSVDVNSYIQTIQSSGNVSAVGVLMKDTAQVLASSEGFQLSSYEAEITQEDGSDRLEIVNEGSNISQLMINRTKPLQGLRIGKTKYQVLRTFDDDNSSCFTVYGKKTMGGCCLAATKTLILVATFDELQGHTAASCNEAISNAAKSLKST